MKVSIEMAVWPARKENTMNQQDVYDVIGYAEVVKDLQTVKGSAVRYAKSGGARYDVYAASLTNREQAAISREGYEYTDVLVLVDKKVGTADWFIVFGFIALPVNPSGWVIGNGVEIPFGTFRTADNPLTRWGKVDLRAVAKSVAHRA